MYSDVVDHHVQEPPDEELTSQSDCFVDQIAEPFHSPNVRTTRGVWTRMAKDEIRAVLYGAAGGEVFAGYTREYFVAYLRDLLGRGPLRTFWSNFSGFSERSPRTLGVDCLLRAGLVAGGVGACEHMVERVSSRDDPVRWRKEIQPTPPLSGSAEERILKTRTDWKMNYWLRLDNQNSMTLPIELRLPFLDYQLIHFAFSLPFSYLIRDGWEKWILRMAMHRLLPDEVLWRRHKMGFPFPLRGWLGRHREHIACSDCSAGVRLRGMRQIDVQLPASTGAKPELPVVRYFHRTLVETMCRRRRPSPTSTAVRLDAL